MSTWLVILAWLFLAIIAIMVLWLPVWILAATLNFIAGLLGHPWRGFPGSPGTTVARPRIPAPVRRAVLKRDGYRCQECGTDQDLVMDHIIAFSKGGASTPENLQVLCRRCNEEKGARP